MGVGIVLAGSVVPVLVERCVRSQLFKSHFTVVVKATLVVVDKHTGSNVLRIY
jgi:hypothetical protein